MKYFEVNFQIKDCEDCPQEVRDVVAALAGEAGFESFEDTPEGLRGYVQQDVFDAALLDGLLATLPFNDARVSYYVSPAADEDWNATWEEEGFEPIIINGECLVYDGRHRPDAHFDVEVEIDAHLAFGTGNHETTRMMISRLLELPLKGKRVLDCGCGTGILGLVALKRGAAHLSAYDIDEWSADNSRHNAVINHLSNYDVLQGDASVLKELPPHSYDVVMANINRNILLNDMPHFIRMLSSGGLLLLSGFYNSDIPLLEEKAKEFGLSLIDKQEENNWAQLSFQ